MDANSKRWIQVTQSAFAWEREALEYVRERLPDRDPYRAWACFQFVARDGSVNDVDVMVLSPRGVYVVEINSWPGRISGDAGHWRWTHADTGRVSVKDNPLPLTNLKAQRLKSLLGSQKALKGKGSPFLQAAIFLSDRNLKCELDPGARHWVFGRDHATPDGAGSGGPAGRLPGIIGELTGASGGAQAGPADLTAVSVQGAGAERRIDFAQAGLFIRAVEQAGVRPSQRMKEVGDWVLERPTDLPGVGYQDFLSHHKAGDRTRARVRIYPLPLGSSPDERRLADRATQREFEILMSLQHPGILRTLGLTGHELGPAVVFEHHPDALWLDQYLVRDGDRLTLPRRLAMIRQIAEALAHAHSRRIVHRALSPRSVLVVDPDGTHPRLLIANWQTGTRQQAVDEPGDLIDVAGAGERPGTTATGSAKKPPGGAPGSAPPTPPRTTSRTPTLLRTRLGDLDALTGDRSVGYSAPEAYSTLDIPGEQLDIFSLGALAYLILTNQAPASSRAELLDVLRRGDGLRVSAVADGLPDDLDLLVQLATQPVASYRPASVADMLTMLGEVEAAIADPDRGGRSATGTAVTGAAGTGTGTDTDADDPDEVDPLTAGPGDRLAGGFEVLRRLGSGSTAVALLARRDDGVEGVLKVAQSVDHDRFLLDEADVLALLQHQSIVRLLAGPLEIGGRTAIFEASAGRETLAQRLRKDGPLHSDLLERFGDDLLDAVRYLEEQGIAHRDLKPDNVGVLARGENDTLHLALFDFSLSRAPAEQLRVGTVGYLDPFLESRPHRRWDVAAERWSAAVTLHEMATGTLPRFGDGRSDPALLDAEATVEHDLFETSLREPLSAFFTRALARDSAERHHSADEMLRAWRQVFLQASETGTSTAGLSVDDRRQALADATLDTPLGVLGLSSRALDACERLAALTVAELLPIPAAQIWAMRGVANPTRREILEALTSLRERFPAVDLTGEATGDEPLPGTGLAPLVAGLIPKSSARNRVQVELLRRLLGLPVDGMFGSELSGGSGGSGLDEPDGLDRPQPHGAPRPDGRPGGRPDARPDGRPADEPNDMASDAPHDHSDHPQLTPHQAPGLTGQPEPSRQPAATAWPAIPGIASAAAVAPGEVHRAVKAARDRWSRTKSVTAVRRVLVQALDQAGGVMTLHEAAEALAAEYASDGEAGSTRATLATAVLRAAVETESAVQAPKLDVRRAATEQGTVIIARHDLAGDGVDAADRAAWAERLGRTADELASADPLLAPARVVEALTTVTAPAGLHPVTPSRLVTLAAATSDRAAASPRQELYPRGLSAERALRLSRPALLGTRLLTVADLVDRVRARYPAAEALPARPLLDPLVDALALGLQWSDDDDAYLVPAPSPNDSTATSLLIARPTTVDRPLTAPVPWGPAEELDERLAHAARDGGFLVLGVAHRYHDLAVDALEHRLGELGTHAVTVDLDELWLRHLRRSAETRRVEWAKVLEADTALPGSTDRTNLARLARDAAETIEAELADQTGLVLATHPGLLARYDQIGLVERLRDRLDRRGATRLHGFWLLVPQADGAAGIVVDGRAVPVITDHQQAVIPRAWIDRHRTRPLAGVAPAHPGAATPGPSPSGTPR